MCTKASSEGSSGHLFNGMKWHMLVVWATLCEFLQISTEHKLLSEHTQHLKSLCNNLSLICHIHAIPKECMHYFRVQEKTVFMYENIDKIYYYCVKYLRCAISICDNNNM
jgi:hypothetical protein